MVLEKPDDTVTEKVEERLDILFSEDEEDVNEKVTDEGISDYPLRELKTIVLSIDWEITDEVMNNFVEQVVLLKDSYKDDKVVLVFLQLLGSIGEYIRVNLGKSHPDAFNLLSSSFKNLDKIVKTENLSDIEKKKLLSVELNRYKELKQKLVLTKSAVEKKQPVEKTAVEEKSKAPSEDIIATLIEIKQMIRTEFKAIKEELKQLRTTLSGLNK